MLLLSPVKESEFPAFIAEVYEDYAQSRAEADHVSLKVARGGIMRTMFRDLPQGMDTPHNDFYHLREVEGHTLVGRLWTTLDLVPVRSLYVSEIMIYQAHRRKGYATAAMKAVEEFAIEAGCVSISLNVFAPNKPARRLYEKVGLRVVSRQMSKPVGP